MSNKDPTSQPLPGLRVRLAMGDPPGDPPEESPWGSRGSRWGTPRGDPPEGPPDLRVPLRIPVESIGVLRPRAPRGAWGSPRIPQGIPRGIKYHLRITNYVGSSPLFFFAHHRFFGAHDGGGLARMVCRRMPTMA